MLAATLKENFVQMKQIENENDNDQQYLLPDYFSFDN